jgi:AcrR family transcriptional regulator
MASEDGLRERKKRATRAALSWAAIRLSVERGYANVRVEDIAEAAGVSTRTFNNYFGSKAEAVVARQVDRTTGVADELRRRDPAEPLWEAIGHAAVAQFLPGPEVAEHPISDHDAWVAGVQLMVAEPSVQAEIIRASVQAEAELAAVIAERTGTDVERDLYPNLVAAAVTAVSIVVIRQSMRTDPPTDVRRLTVEALRQLAAGLPTP